MMTNEAQRTAAHTPAGVTDCSCGEHFQTGRGLQLHLRNVNRVTSSAGGWEAYDGHDHQLGRTLLLEFGKPRVIAEFKDATPAEIALAAAAPALLEALDELMKATPLPLRNTRQREAFESANAIIRAARGEE